MGQLKSLWFILIEAPNDAFKTSQLGDESQSFSLISQRGQPADSNRFQQKIPNVFETGQASAVTRANGNSSGSFSSSAGLARIVMCASNLLPQSTGYHMISLDTEQWYDLIQSDTIWYWYKQQFSQGTLPSPSISGRVHAPHAREGAPSRPPARHLKR